MNNSQRVALFSFVEIKDVITSESFVFSVPAGIGNKADLLLSLAKAGKFPTYFGYNWDALEDCMRDFSWISNKRIIMVHTDLPLAENKNDLSTYLKILSEAVKFWDSNKLHELIVCFSFQAKPSIIQSLGHCEQ